MGTEILSTKVTIESVFDPLVEFLEIAVTVNGERSWKTYGPDISTGFGAAQGIGGLEAITKEATGATTAVLHNAQGHVIGWQKDIDPDITWSDVQYYGYGPQPGSNVQTLTPDVEIVETLNWQGRRIDPTGYYNLGARNYDPTSGRFLEPDPAGHSASMGLYDYANGDPINYFDPDGRFFKKLFKKIGSFIKKAAKVVKKVVKKVGKFVKKYWKPILTIAVSVAVVWATGGFALADPSFWTVVGYGALGGAAGGATSAALNGGGVKDVLKGAVMGGIRGAVSAGITYGVAEVAGGLSGENFHGLGGKLGSAIKDGSYGAKELALHAAKITSNGISGGITSEIFGGDFIDGMAGGAVSAAFSPISSGMFHDGNVVGAFGVAGLSGGLGSLAVGGNFESGAIAGVFNFAFNELAGSSERSRNRKLSYGKPRGPSMLDRAMSRAWSNSKMVGNAFMEDPGAILGAAWEGGVDGFQQTIDTAIPLYDPLSGYYDPNGPGMQAGKFAAEIGLTAIPTGFGVAAAHKIGQLYKIPDKLYHHTSFASKAYFDSVGGIPGSTRWGFRSIYGGGVYMTRTANKWIAKNIQGADSIEVLLTIPTKGLNVKRTIFPGTFRTDKSSILLKGD